MSNNSKKYEINIFDVRDVKKAEKALSKLKDTLKSEKFMDYLAQKCMIELNRIIDENLNTDEYTTDYRDNNNYETTKDQIRIYNDSMVDLSNLSPETLANYPDGLSLAKLIEFGTGIKGTDSDAYDWQTEVNPERDYDKGWVYERDGQLHWTKGQQGHFIYQKLKDTVEQKISDWVQDYLKSEID